MTKDAQKPDPDVARLTQARKELDEVKERGRSVTPLLDRLHNHLTENRFAERFVLAMEQNTKGRHA